VRANPGSGRCFPDLRRERRARDRLPARRRHYRLKALRFGRCRQDVISWMRIYPHILRSEKNVTGKAWDGVANKIRISKGQWGLLF
jgi:hypothetical protein